MGVEAGTSAGWVGREARQARLQQLGRRRRDTDAQIASFRDFLDRIAEQLRRALETGRKDYARELLSRRLALRARLSEVEGRQRVLLEEERRLRAELESSPTSPDGTGPYPPGPYPPGAYPPGSYPPGSYPAPGSVPTPYPAMPPTSFLPAPERPGR